MFLILFFNPFNDLAISISLISLVARLASRDDILSLFQLFSFINILFLSALLWFSTIIFLSPRGSFFLFHLHIIFDSESFSSSLKFSILYSDNLWLVCIFRGPILVHVFLVNKNCVFHLYSYRFNYTFS